MRIKFNEWGHVFESAPTIFLNGIVMGDVIEADEEAGHIIVYDTDHQGNYIRDADGSSWRTRKITGRVSIEGKKREAITTFGREIDWSQYRGLWGLRDVDDKR